MHNKKGPMGPGMDASNVKNFKGTLLRILKDLKKYRVTIFFVFLFAIASTIFAIVGPKILGIVTEEIYSGIVAKIANTGGINFDNIIRILLILLGLYAFSLIFSFIEGFLMSGVANRYSYELREKLSLKIARLPMKYFDSQTNGEVLSRFTNDVDTLNQSLNQSITQVITSLTTIIGVLVMMFSINFTMTIVALFIIPLCMVVVKKIVSKSQKYFIQQQEYLGSLNGHIEEIYGGHDIVTIFNGEKKALDTFCTLNDQLYHTAWKSQFLSSIMHPIMMFIGNLSYVVISILGGWFVIQGKIVVGDILSFTQYVRNFINPIGQLAQVMNMIQSAVAGAERVYGFLDEEEETPDIEKAESISNIEGNVTFKNVQFGYHEDRMIIHNFNGKIKKGQKIAIVGPTGAGKSTIIKLLMRFYDVNAGEILLDGKNIKNFKRSELRSVFGMVLQDTWLFSGTIEENIKYGKLDATMDEVIDACKMARVDHYIKTLPDGYHMVLNEESDNISGGQKQLLTIARVILADPKILILDEATSSVDTRTELLIQEAMDRLMEGRTSFIIAHRLSTIRNADLILVMNNGDIVETGNHEELLAKNGFYANLYNSQFVEE